MKKVVKNNTYTYVYTCISKLIIIFSFMAGGVDYSINHPEYLKNLLCVFLGLWYYFTSLKIKKIC